MTTRPVSKRDSFLARAPRELPKSSHAGAGNASRLRGCTLFGMDEAARRRALEGLNSCAVLAGILGIAYADWLVEGNVSLGFLYLLPLGLSAFKHRVRTSLLLAVICVALRQWLGPFEYFGWHLFSRSALTLSIFSAFVGVVHRAAQRQTRLEETVREQRDQLAQELVLAEAVQRRLLPQQVPRQGDLDIAAWMLPARGVGGDHYDFIEVGGERLVVVVSDVSGKGLAAALIMPAVWMALRVLAPNAKSPEQVVTELNELLYTVSDSTRFVTLFYADFDLSNHTLRYVNAGHHPPLLVRPGCPEVPSLELGGPVVGLLPRISYESGQVDLQAGDTVLLYTDGLVEAENLRGDQYSPENVRAVVADNPYPTAEQLLNRIRESAVEFSGGQGFQDDATLIVIRVP